MRPKNIELEHLTMGEMVSVIKFCDEECKRYTADYTSNRMQNVDVAAKERDRIFSISAFLRRKLKEKLIEDYDKILAKNEKLFS